MTESVAPKTRAGGRPDPARRRFAWFVVVASLLHMPLTPIGALLGLLSLLRAPAEEQAAEQLNAIPVSLLSADELARLGLGEPSPPPAEPDPAEAPAEETPVDLAVAAPKPPPKPKPKQVAPESGDGGPDARAADAAPLADAGPAPVASAAAPPGDGGPAAPPEEGPSSGDPMALVGKSTGVADPNANVKLLLINETLRGLPIAGRISKIVSRLPQWRSFFGPTGIDPVRDIDRMYVTGPQFRVSTEVVAVLEYQVPRATMRKAIDTLVNREPKGEWFDTKVPAARARADRAERIFVLPNSHLLLMVPPHLKDDAIAKAPNLGMPAVGGRAVVIAFIATPWRAFLGLRMPVEIPRTISSASLTVTPTDDGGAVVHIEAVDDSPESARADASLLTRAINAVTQQNLGKLGSLFLGAETLSFVEPVDLRAKGKIVSGDARVTPKQLARLLGFVEGWLDSIEGARPGAPRPGPSGAAPAAPSAVSR